MRRRPAPPPSAQQMIREYLGRVSVAATKVLPKGDRLLFVGRTRAAIEAKVGPLASADADAVANALTSLGDPDELANRERERLYSARRRGAARRAASTLETQQGVQAGRWRVQGRALGNPGRAPASPGGGRRPAARAPAGAAQGRRRTRGWPHRGLTGPDEPQPAGTAQPAKQEQPRNRNAAKQEQPAKRAVRPAGKPGRVPHPADPPDAASPPADLSLPPALPRRPGSSRKRCPGRGCPEQALEEGWPTEPAPAGAGSATRQPRDSGLRGTAHARGPPLRLACPVPDLAALEAEAPEPGAPGWEQTPGAGRTPGRGRGAEPGTPGSGGPEQNGTPPGWLRPGRPAAAPGETGRCRSCLA